MTIFWSALGSSFRRPPLLPTPPSNVVAKKALFSTHFAQDSTLFSGVRGGVTSFDNITVKVPTLLTAIAPLRLLCRQIQSYE